MAARVAAMLVAAVVPVVHAGWMDSLQGTMSSGLGSLKEATKSKASHLLEAGENMTGSALEQAENAGCDMKVWEDIVSVNKTMVNQLQNDCESTASKVPFMHDHVYGACESMGMWNINRTLEGQKEKNKKDCMDFLHEAPGDMAGALEKYSQRSKETLTKKVGPSIKEAVAKAEEAVRGHGSGEVGDEELQEGTELKFSVSGFVLSQVSSAVPAAIASFAVATAVVAGALVLRRTDQVRVLDEEQGFLAA